MIMKKVKGLLYVWLALIMSFSQIIDVNAQDNSYTYSDSATSNGVTLKVEWNEPKLGEEITFHVSASGGSGKYKFRMASPLYSSTTSYPYEFEDVMDSSRVYLNYTSECESTDYAFKMMASGMYYYHFYLMDESSGVTYLRTNTFITVSDSNYPSVNTLVNNIVSQCKTGSDYQTALNLHDYLIDHMEYDNSLKWSSAESALTRGLGTCQSYEAAYSKLLSAARIENKEIRDTTDGHTWNAVKLDGNWYQIDCTWDDSTSTYSSVAQRHLYFGLTDELMAIAHNGHTSIYTDSSYSTRSTSLEDNYYVKSGEAKTWANSYLERIQSNLNQKNTSFTITTDNSSDPASISGIQNGIIAYVLNTMDWNTDSTNINLSVTSSATQLTFTASYQDKCTNHTWDTGTITTQPTCTEKGIKTYTCTNCGETKTEDIDALGHNYSSEWTIDKDATCNEEGSKSHHCTRCNDKTDVTVIPVNNEHTWDNGKITKKATYTSVGTKLYTCKNCSSTRTENYKLTDYTESVTYRTHVQDYGWQSYVSDGSMSGTSGQSKRLEGINIKIKNASVDGSIQYRTHIQDIGWQSWKSDGDMSGTSGQSKRLEAIQIKLTGELAETYDVYYRVHAQDYGWLDWAKNGESAGTEGLSKRLEGIEIKLVKKGESAPGKTSKPFVYKMISYRTHVQDIGWQDYVSDGSMSGTSGQSKRLEGIYIKLSSNISGSIQYQTHVQDIGWQGWKTNNEMSGTSGQSKRLEAIKIKLTGEAAEKYDVYYRVHCQDFGWVGWAKNGENSGSEGYSKRLEGIEIVLVEKGGSAPGSTKKCFYKK